MSGEQKERLKMADCEKAVESAGSEIQSATKGSPKPSPTKSTGTYLDTSGFIFNCVIITMK